MTFCSTIGKGEAPTFKPIEVKVGSAKMPHTLITGAGGQKFQTYELTAPGLTKDGLSGKPWRGFDPSSMGRHWANTPEQMERWNAEALIHWPKDGGWPRRRDAQPFDVSSRTVVVGDIWTDIDRLNQTAKERIGYPTQKPIALLERIILASSNEGDVVLDPFCGCGTTIHAAQRANRQWIGIDVTILAINTIAKRLHESFQDLKYEFSGLPIDAEGALELAKRAKHQFQEWAVNAMGGELGPVGADRGIDGKLRFEIGPGIFESALIQVKGGQAVGPSAVRDLNGTLLREGSKIGILFTAYPPTTEMKKDAAAAGSVTFPNWPDRFQRIQIISVNDWFEDKRPDFPGRPVPQRVGRAEPMGSRPGENLVLPGIESLPPPVRKATVIQVSEVVRESLAGAPKRPMRAPGYPKQRRTKAKTQD